MHPKRQLKSRLIGLLMSGAAMLSLGSAAFAAGPTVDFPAYGGNQAGTRYSPLTQLNKTNVGKLKEAWRFEMPKGQLETQPIVVGRTLYALTTDGKVIALDGATGREVWSFASKTAGGRGRGVAMWRSGKERRLIVSAGASIFELDPETGAQIASFGKDGVVDLRENLRGEARGNSVNMGSPPSLYKDIFITGGGVSESTPGSPGDIRGWDVRTGKLLWTFHTIPYPGEFGADSWPADAYKTAGGANNWTGGVLDEKRGIFFAGTGSAADDFYGAGRLGNNLYANSVIALDAATGKRLWHFQTIHHDLWDADFAAPPVLMTVTKNGKKIDAVAASNKQGFVYLFNRVTGESLFPIDEVAAPPSTVPGEVASPTQPVPRLPMPLAPQGLTADTLTTRSPEAAAWALEKFKTFAGGPRFTPPMVDKETITGPGMSGGVEWGGMAADPKGVLYANSQNIVWTSGVRLVTPAAGSTAPPKYRSIGDRRFYDPDGYPASAAPWGTLNAIDMNTGKYLWRIPFGEYPDLVAQGIRNTGTENYGGPVVTASGLLFIGATNFDRKLHAYDTSNGEVLWETVLPYSGNATPAVYMIDGKQYVAIAASGGRDKDLMPGGKRRGPEGAAYIAFALPN